MALSDKERMMLYLLLAVVGLLLLIWVFQEKPSRATLPHVSMPHLSQSQRQALMTLGKNEIASLKSKYCPVCQDNSGQCNCPAQIPPRPTMEDAQNVCAGMGMANGVPFTADCVNAIFGVYGCNNRYAPDTPTDQINYNSTDSYTFTFNDIANDAYLWSSLTDDAHRNGCYAPGGVPNN